MSSQHLKHPIDGPIKIVGVVLAGGQSRRMGGSDKFLQPVNGSNLLRGVLERFTPQLDTIIISSNSPPAAIHAALDRVPEFQAIPIISDIIPDFAGPLAGVHSAMKWSHDNNRSGATHVISVAADTPFFPLNYVETMVGFAQSQVPASIILAQSHGRYHPIFGLWPIVLHQDLEDALLNGVRKIRAWVNEHPNGSLNFQDEIVNGTQIDPFFNVNEPEDFKRYMELTSVKRYMELTSAQAGQ